jgi:hypothetical protein
MLCETVLLNRTRPYVLRSTVSRSIEAVRVPISKFVILAVVAVAGRVHFVFTHSSFHSCVSVSWLLLLVRCSKTVWGTRSVSWSRCLMAEHPFFRIFVLVARISLSEVFPGKWRGHISVSVVTCLSLRWKTEKLDLKFRQGWSIV